MIWANDLEKSDKSTGQRINLPRLGQKYGTPLKQPPPLAPTRPSTQMQLQTRFDLFRSHQCSIAATPLQKVNSYLYSLKFLATIPLLNPRYYLIAKIQTKLLPPSPPPILD